MTIRAAKTSIAIMTLRPAVVNYQEVSTILQAQIEDALAGKKTPASAMADADKAAAHTR